MVFHKSNPEPNRVLAEHPVAQTSPTPSYAAKRGGVGRSHPAGARAERARPPALTQARTAPDSGREGVGDPICQRHSCLHPYSLHAWEWFHLGRVYEACLVEDCTCNDFKAKGGDAA